MSEKVSAVAKQMTHWCVGRGLCRTRALKFVFVVDDVDDRRRINYKKSGDDGFFPLRTPRSPKREREKRTPPLNEEKVAIARRAKISCTPKSHFLRK
jgi:hypothetical protein